MFLYCPVDGFRIAYAELLIHIIKMLEPLEREAIHKIVNERARGIKSVILDFIDQYLAAEKVRKKTFFLIFLSSS